MISQDLLRKDICGITYALKRRDKGIDLSEFSKKDAHCRKLRSHYENIQAQRNELSRQSKKSPPTADLMAKGQQLKKQSEELKIELMHCEEQLKQWLMQLPNLPCNSVPDGETEADNKVLKQWGHPRRFHFAPKDHVELSEAVHLMDFEQAAQISGARFVFLKGEIAKLHRILAQFMLEMHTKQHGYQEVLSPCLVRAGALYGTGQLPKFSEDLFKLESSTSEKEATYLIPTAEVPLTNLVSNTLLKSLETPLKWVSHSNCFRAEAGSYGKDTRGIIRQHQFEKVELVQVVRPEQSCNALESLTRDAERVLEALELPYQRVALCAGDLGFSAAKTYDLEVWLPSQNRYREISSCSYCGDFQARRLNARYLAGYLQHNHSQNIRFVHTLNGSGLAVGRTLCAVLENYQTDSGNILIPSALKAYFPGKTYLLER